MDLGFAAIAVVLGSRPQVHCVKFTVSAVSRQFCIICADRGLRDS